MPYHVAKRDGKYRVVKQDGSIAKNSAGTALDGGGHSTRQQAEKQISAIGMSEHKK